MTIPTRQPRVKSRQKNAEAVQRMPPSYINSVVPHSFVHGRVVQGHRGPVLALEHTAAPVQARRALVDEHLHDTTQVLHYAHDVMKNKEYLLSSAEEDHNKAQHHARSESTLRGGGNQLTSWVPGRAGD